MEAIRQLTVGQMVRRVRRFVPELDSTLICDHLHLQGCSCLLESNVHDWVRFFDCLFIDGYPP
jgi:hypothetical protein